MTYKKKRIKKKPNKNDMKLERQHSSAPSLGEIFPELRSLKLSLLITNKTGLVLQEDLLEYQASDPVDLVIPCPGGCDSGATSLQEKIEGMVQTRKTRDEGRARCASSLYSADNPCGCDLKCQILLEYFPTQD